MTDKSPITQNYPICRLQVVVERLDPQLNEPTDQNSIKVRKVVKPTNEKMSSYNFED